MPGNLAHRSGRSRRLLLGVGLALLTLQGWVPGALAQTGDSRPLRYVVPFAPGGGSDLVARAMQPRMSAVAGQPVVIENRPGGGITLASGLVAKSPPDGNTILIVTIAHAVNPSLYSEMPYDTGRDFTAISMAAAAAVMLVVHPSVPARTLAEFIALAKARPGTLNYASPGNGSPTHLSAELLRSMTGAEFVHIPYKGAGPATADLLGGQVQFSFSSVGVAAPHVKAGKLRALGVTTLKRSTVLPEVPAMAEALPGYEIVSWQAILGPARLPPEAVRRLNQIIVSTLNTPDVRDALRGQGYDASPSTPEEAAQFIDREIQRYSKLVKTVGVRPD